LKHSRTTVRVCDYDPAHKTHTEKKLNEEFKNTAQKTIYY